MIDICCEEFTNIDVSLNISELCCIRIGKRWHQKRKPLQIPGGPIPWCDKVTYLGINIVAAAKFTCCLIG